MAKRFNLITREVLYKVHKATIGENTSTSVLAKVYRVRHDELTKRLKQYRIDYNLPNPLSMLEMSKKAAKAIANSDDGYDKKPRTVVGKGVLK